MRAVNWHQRDICRGARTILLLELLELCPQLTEEDSLWVLEMFLRAAVVTTVGLQLTVELTELLCGVRTEDGAGVGDGDHVDGVLHLQDLLPQLTQGLGLLVSGVLTGAKHALETSH